MVQTACLGGRCAHPSLTAASLLCSMTSWGFSLTAAENISQMKSHVRAALLNAFSDLDLLNGAAFLSGFAFGGAQGLTPSVTSELFGLRNFASNYSALQLGPALGMLS